MYSLRENRKLGGRDRYCQEKSRIQYRVNRGIVSSAINILIQIR